MHSQQVVRVHCDVHGNDRKSSRAALHWPGHEHPHEQVDVVNGGLLDVVDVLHHHSRMNGTSQAKLRLRLGRITAGSVHIW